ncbi:MAG: PqqD family protein [Acidobacteriota bacterium]|nr:PqqD family protein [Acidobacteriota bacterium]MDH3784575.1 PqqD family protein [Acidobacteriota bacterium]
MTDKAYPRRHPDTAYREIGEEGGLVVMTQRSEVKVLNPVGVKIYALLDGEHSSAAIAEAIAEEFDVSTDEAAADVEAFVSQLRENGMLAEPTEEVSVE